jgi:hypothetical protein
MSRRLKAYEALLRMAEAKELRADVALSAAVGEEGACRSRLAVEVAQRNAIASAGRGGMAGGRIDMSRYEVLSSLDVAFAERQQLASVDLAAATRTRETRATEGLLAKRYRERVSDHLGKFTRVLHGERTAKSQEDAIELWLDSEDRP